MMITTTTVMTIVILKHDALKSTAAILHGSYALL